MAFFIRLTTLVALLAISTSSFSQICDCVTTGNCPVPVNDNGTYNGTLNVTVNGDNDLGVNPITSVCFTITHTWIGDLSVSMTSPGGVNYLLMADVNNNYGGCGMQEDNLDICIVTGDNNPLTNNTEYMCNSAPCAAGTCCLTGNWTVACGGVTDPINNAQEAPNCDLNDFNVPGDPANGTWTLTVVDVCNMDTGTIDNFSLTFANGIETCIYCDPDGGTLDSMEVASCYGEDDLMLDLEPNYTGSPPDSTYNYGFVISQNGVVLQLDSIADLTSQPPGIYQVHGMSYYMGDTSDIDGIIGLDTATVISQLASTTAPFCGDLSSNFVTVNILPTIPVTEVDTAVCEGGCIMVGTQEICSSQSITLQSVHGCDSVVNVTINEVVVTAVIDPTAPPALTCAGPTVTLDGSGSTGSIYNWSGPNSFSSDQPSITVSESGDYTLTVSDDTVIPACEASTTVTVGDNIVPPDLSVAGAAPQICDGEIFDLNALNIQDANSTNPVITFHSDTPATAANELSSANVNPNTTTTYYILGTNGACSDEIDFIITVNNVPSADFTTDAVVCSTAAAAISYTGTASANATYTWDFNGGVASPGTGAGPHTVTWPTGGDYSITLTVEENGCTSALFTQNVSVEDPLPAPQVTCSSTTSTITFTWDDVPGSTGFDVNVISSPSGNVGMDDADPNTYIFENLNPNDVAVIEVVANGNGACGNSSMQASCTADDCPDVTVVIDPVPDICIDPPTPNIDLTATAIGGDGTGTFIWSGDGVTISGNFDPEQVPLGTHTITVDYYEGNCIYPGTTIDIDIYETPLVAIDVPFNICSGDPVPVVFAGIAPPGSTYTWEFENGTVVSGTGPGPIEVVWPIGGTYDISLTVESPAGCVSETLVQPTELVTPLDEPTISCSATTSSVTFTWPIDQLATSYDVNFPDGLVIQDQSVTGFHIYEVINLQPGDVVPIEVTAVGAITCGNAFFQTSCEVEDCPDVTMSIHAVADICRSASTTPFNLTADVTGATPNGTLTWTGDGVDANGLFDPNQADIGSNTISLTYEEGTCFFAETITFNVFETPTAEFTADASVCIGNAATVTYTGTNNTNLNYTWDFAGGDAATNTGPGPHDVTWAADGTYTISLSVENEDGCVSETATFDVAVEEPIQEPTINCTVTTTSIVFSWNSVSGTLDSTISVSVPQPGVLNGNTYTLDGLPPGTPVDFELTLVGAGNCPPTVATSSCSTDACPTISINIDAVSDMCLGQSNPVQLNAAVTGSDGSGIGTWSGDGVNVTTGLFDPGAAGVGTHLVKYNFEEAACTYEGSIEINVFAQPVISFTADATVCITDFNTITFDGTANNNAIFTWDFDGGTAVPGTGPGPHQVLWDTPGSKTVTLNIQDNGCTAPQFQQQVQVDEELTAPTVTCSATTESVEFAWTDVPNATGYQITLPGQSPQTVTDLTYSVNGLDPGQTINLQITPIGNTVCPAPTANVPCSANLCPDVTVDVMPVGPICLMASTSSFSLEANVTGAGGVGNGLWSGQGVINQATGFFDPMTAGEGTHTIVYDYQITNCYFSDEIEISIAPPPIADAGEDASLSCWDSESSVLLGGDGNSTGPDVLFEWTTTNGELPANTNVLHPEVEVPGTYTLTATNVVAGCSSTDEITISGVQGLPEPSVSFAPTDCTGGNTTVMVAPMGGGTGPYLYSLNGEPYIAQDTFSFFAAGCLSAFRHGCGRL